MCTVLLTLLEMLGCPAKLFLDQWQRVNGCRCVAKEGSEIPTDPGKSFPLLLYLCFLKCPYCPLTSGSYTCHSIITSSSTCSFSNHRFLFSSHYFPLPFCPPQHCFRCNLLPTFFFFYPALCFCDVSWRPPTWPRAKSTRGLGYTPSLQFSFSNLLRSMLR